MFRIAHIFAVAAALTFHGAAAPQAFAQEINPDAVAAKLGDLVIEAPWAVEKQKNLVAAYMRVHNLGEGDVLVDAISEDANATVLARIERKEGVERAVKVDSIPVEGKGVTSLDPDGLHVLMVGIEDGVKGGDVLPLVLVFEEAGEVEVLVSVALVQ